MRDIGRVSVSKQGYTEPYPHHCSACGSSFPFHCTPNLLISPHHNHATRPPSLLHPPSFYLQKVNDSSKYILDFVSLQYHTEQVWRGACCLYFCAG